MVNSSMKEKYISMEKELNQEHSLLQKNISTISTLRVISFLVGAGLFIVGAADALLWAEILGVIFLLVFIYFVKRHSDLYAEAEVVDSKLTVVGNYIKRFGEEWRKFSETGKDFLYKEDTVPGDLDLIGDDSLFQLINVCHTDKGKEKLITSMKLVNPHLDSIKDRNEAVAELMTKTDFSVEFESAGLRLDSKKRKFKTEDFIEYCNAEAKGNLPKWADICRLVVPIIIITTLILWAFGIIGYGVPLSCFLISISFCSQTKRVTDKVIRPLFDVSYGVSDYLTMLEHIDNERFDSKLLFDIKSNISGEKGSVTAFKELKAICQGYTICFNPAIHLILSGVILWDYQLAHLMSKWKKKYGDVVANSFDYIGSVEELLSLSVVGVIRNTCWGEIDCVEKNSVELHCENLYHPLISPEKVVANSAKLKAGITIITGSNMSGKTTFLRTIAVNLALAYMGAPVCGKSLKSNYMKLFTSMRVTDDVAGGISTFYAEILRIKAMAEAKATNIPMLCLIDEIFKGTNSADRIVGATEVIKQLSGDRCMTVVSTHDFELCNITDGEGKLATNYHFEEYYHNDELKFDYKIKDGRCTTTNAKEILRMAGFELNI